MVVCNNCAAILGESSQAGEIKFVWEIIDQDPDFVFPDYHGAQMTIQDCWLAVEKRHVQENIRSLLRKMNIQYVELEENFDKTRFCGTNLLTPCSEGNAKLAQQRYVETGAGMFTPCSPEQQREKMREHCSQITTDQVICYCTACLAGINMGGKQGIHLLDLVFPEEGFLDQ